ncbi:MAG: hypothetical protein EHM93_20215 [Bacteroidales bacterium]|nr:MAG: hypothetical protein EHM93_20215 [Bacteroidales bacterium]
MIRSLVLIASLLCISFPSQSNSTIAANLGSANDTLYPPISKRKAAVILIDFPGIKPENRKLFPTAKEVQEYYFGDDIKNYFNTISYDKFSYDGKVYGYFTMPDSLTKERQNNEYIIQTTEKYDLKIDGFEKEGFTCLTFLICHDVYEQRGLSAANFANFTVNGKFYEKQNVMYLGQWINQETNTYSRIWQYNIRYGEGEKDIETGNMPLNLRYNQGIFIHEFIHFITGSENIPHSNLSVNNGKFDYELKDTLQPKSFFDLEYGNKFDIMGGGSSFALSLNSGYRKLAGWCDSENTKTMNAPGEYKLTLFPLNRKKGIRVGEIRLVNKPKRNENVDYPGYFLEVREADTWDKTLSNPRVAENTKGILIMKCDGYKTLLLDMSPTKNFIVNNKHSVDYTDMVLKPGMAYENDDIKLWNVKANRDGSFTLSVKVK